MSVRLPARVVPALALALLVSLSPASVRAQEPAPSQPAHGAGQHEDHAGHEEPQATPPTHDHMGHEMPETQAPGPQIPPITDADRAAAFPDVEDHTVHDDVVHYFVLFDQLEWTRGNGLDGGNWDTKGWIGHDVNRVWFRTEGEGEGGRLDAAEAHLLFGRAIARWWELVAGVRQDFEPGPAQTWAAVGIQGLAPYWFEVEATGYVGEGGRTHLRLETEYELLLTNRLVLQPLVELNIHGKSDPEREVGAGLSSLETGLRLRYEVRRELAPYLGVTWNRKFLGTADLARAAGDHVGAVRLILGVRMWM